MKPVKLLRAFLKSWLGCDRGLTVPEMIENGMKMGKNVHFDPTSDFDFSHCWLITIGNNVTFGPRTFVLAHDASTKIHLGYTKIGKVQIDDYTFIGLGSIIMPGTHIGKNCIIGANSVVTGEVPDGSVYVGSPARFVCTTREYLEKQKQNMKKYPVYDARYTGDGGITDEMKQQMIDEMVEGKGFVE